MTRDEWRRLPPEAVIRVFGVNYWMKDPGYGVLRPLFKTLEQDPAYTIEFDPNHPEFEDAVYLGMTYREYMQLERWDGRRIHGFSPSDKIWAGDLPPDDVDFSNGAMSSEGEIRKAALNRGRP